ncbi:3-hydroxyanthranilic acid dioxygenase [Brevibacillus sp. CF112]|nr:3-hydroxyanthranilic acid dioxygenase [Brevibacillus sp. CF112]
MSTITKPVNIWKFIEENKDSLKPPVNNKVV